MLHRASCKNWVEFWKEVCGPKSINLGQIVHMYFYICDLYYQPHRAYHNFKHIDQCLREFDQAKHLAVDPYAVEAAIWFHDLIYLPLDKDNEEKSAKVAYDKMCCTPADFNQKVFNHIMATKHKVLPVDPDSQLLVDIDLSILGQSQDKFDEYERRIRQEYYWVSEDVFTSGRSGILMSFLERPAIYSTSFFKDRYEEQARENITRSLAQLSKSP